MHRPLLFAAALALATVAQADSRVPRQLVQMGRLLDGQDHPVTGEHKLKFAIFEDFRKDPTKPKAALWEDTYTVAMSAEGTYSAVLGDVAAGENHKALTLDGAGNDRFLAISIDGGGELEPRLRIGSTAFALVAAVAEDVTCAGCVTTEKLADKAITNAKLADGTIELAKLKREANGHVGGLDADLLDGLDASAFAPAAIETKIDAIQASTGEGLSARVDNLGPRIDAVGTKVDGVGTKVDAVGTTLGGKVDGVGTTLGTKVDGVGTKVDGLGTTLGTKVDGVGMKVDGVGTKVDGVGTKVDGVGTKVDGVGTKVDGVKTNTDALAAKLDQLLTRHQYSQNCKDSWVASAWGAPGDTNGYQACMHDGRWHLALDTQNLANGGTLAQLTGWISAGANARVTTNSVVMGEECVRVEPRSNGRLVCLGPFHEHPNTGKGAGGSAYSFHWIAFNVDTDGVQWHSAYMYNTNGSMPVSYSPAGGDVNTWGVNWFANAATTQAKWWVRF